MIPGQKATRRQLLIRYHVRTESPVRIDIEAAVSRDREVWQRIDAADRRGRIHQDDLFELVEQTPGVK